MLYPLYHHLTRLSAPFLRAMTWHRLAQGKEIKDRIHERYGIASIARPEGNLLWCHAASVGESLSILPLLPELQTRLPTWRFLMTTSTKTSAELMAERLPAFVNHQFIPWDCPQWVEAFLNHWHPEAVLWVESELWPNMLEAFQQRKLPVALLNARLRPKTFQRWSRVPGFAKHILSSFHLILAGARSYVPLFKSLGAHDVRYVGSLKFGSHPLPVNRADLHDMTQVIQERFCIALISTHSDEEAMLCDMIHRLNQHFSQILFIWVPRQPKRGSFIRTSIEKYGLSVAQRSLRETITHQTSVYIADTIGETGLWYSLAKIAVIGGSFIPHGGQNPIEGTHFGCGILYGPHMFNFPELCGALEEAHASIPVTDMQALIETITTLMTHPHQLLQLQTAAKELATKHQDVIGSYATEILNGLSLQ